MKLSLFVYFQVVLAIRCHDLRSNSALMHHILRSPNENETPALNWDIFRLQLANIRHLIENLPPPWSNAIYSRHNVKIWI